MAKVDREPDGPNEQRQQAGRRCQGTLQGQNARHSNLEDNQTDYDPVTDHWPRPACGVLVVIHGV